MKPYKQFISEVVRDAARAKKLGMYLANRHNQRKKSPSDRIATFLNLRKTDDLIHFDNFKKEHQKLGEHLYRKAEKSGKIRDYLTTPVTKVAIKDIIPTQDATHFTSSGYDQKVLDKTPVKLMRHKGKILMADGHHRLLDHKLRGETHIDSKILDID